jgi:nucleotide-binding universal stress UspA family protein
MKSIVVHLREGAALPSRLSTATALAQRHEAHLVGLCTQPADMHIPASLRGRGASMGFLREMKDAADAHERHCRTIFDAEIARAGVSAEWRRDDGEPMEALALHSRYADVVIVSQTPPANIEEFLTGERPDHLALTSACPTLVLPHGKPGASLGRHVLIAWRSGRQAARAVRDGLAVLRQAERVTVLTIGPVEQDHLPGAEIATYLFRHGLKVETRTNYGDDEPGEVILAIAREIGADLVVMGAYGRSRLRELILGGTTKHMLSHATLPLWLSH